VGRDGHALGRLVDLDQEIGARGRGEDERRQCGGESGEDTHGTASSPGWLTALTPRGAALRRGRDLIKSVAGRRFHGIPEAFWRHGLSPFAAFLPLPWRASPLPLRERVRTRR